MARELAQLARDARLPYARLTGQNYDLSIAGLGPAPEAQQNLDLLLTPNKRRESTTMHRLETTLDRTRPKRAERFCRSCEAQEDWMVARAPMKRLAAT